LKKYNIKQYYDSKHKEIYIAMYERLRQIEAQKLQKALTGEKTTFSKVAVPNKTIISSKL